MSVWRFALVGVVTSCFACGPESEPRVWQTVARDLPAGLLSVWGTSADDVYVVGGDTGDGQGPLIAHYDGTSWTRLESGHTGDLWWVFGFAGGPVYMGGEGGAILRYEQGSFTRMQTPGTGTIFGIWGADPENVWAVGGSLGGAGGGFAWRLNGDSWVAAPELPATIPERVALWKVFGRAPDDAWMVGTNGIALRWDGSTLTEVNTGVNESLFTVHADADRYLAVGGFGSAIVLESTGDTWHDITPDEHMPGLVGVCTVGDKAFVVGHEGTIAEQRGEWQLESLTLEETFHSVWVDPDGGVWAVGGQVLTLPLVNGVVVYSGSISVGELQ